MSVLEHPLLSIIIPNLNEAGSLPRLIRQLQAQEGVQLDIIVADGGSTDTSAAQAESLGARVLRCERGRAKQLNAGVAAATGEDLLVLHADSVINDTRLIINAWQAWQQALANETQNNIAGHFSLTFERDGKGNQWAFRYISEKSATNRPQTVNGDQGLLIQKIFLQELGGFDDSMPFFEDQRIGYRIYQEGRWLLLPGKLHTSGRRFETEGFHRRYILLSLIMGLYWTNTHEFFARARNIYVNQDETQKLRLWPFFRAIWAMLIKDLGWWKSAVQWYRVGRYVRENSWQLFFALDVGMRKRLGEGQYPFTQFHDKYIHPIVNNVVVNLIITALVFIWYMLVLGPVFFILDFRLREPVENAA